MKRRSFLVGAAASVPVTAFTGATAAPAPAPARPVLTGAQRLAHDGWKALSGRKIGVLTNPTGVLADLRHIVDDMHTSANVDVGAVFGPEHGFRGTAQAGGSEGDYTDPRTQIPVYDAYGADSAKLARLFSKAGVEELVFDIADVGARFYTYIWSLYTAMRAAASIGIAVTVLDRPNPLGGRALGPLLDPRFSSGVGEEPIVQQHGMTVGELARLFNDEFLPRVDGHKLESLHVVELRGWSRAHLFDDTGLPWVAPSPNMPTTRTAALYPGTGMFEGTVFSEGRGTTQPFEIIGAPKLNWRWAEELNAARLPGVAFRETYFRPQFSKHEGKMCGGVQIHLTEPDKAEPIRTAVTMIVAAKRLYPEQFGWREDNYIDKLFGSDRLRVMVNSGASTEEITRTWDSELEDFRRMREPYLLYW